MPVVAAALPAMRAYLLRDARDDRGEPLVQRRPLGSSLFADLAHALHHPSALDLRLHREDGSLVPTELVGIQDTAQLLALPEPEESGAARDDAEWTEVGWPEAEDDGRR